MRLYADRPAGTIDRARKLRRDAPAPERRLLRPLRETFPDFKWRHQAPIGPYFADMLRFSQKLAIAVGGDTHAEAALHDARRAAIFRQKGFRTIGFANRDVMENLNGVLRQSSFPLREKQGPRACEKGDAA